MTQAGAQETPAILEETQEEVLEMLVLLVVVTRVEIQAVLVMLVAQEVETTMMEVPVVLVMLVVQEVEAMTVEVPGTLVALAVVTKEELPRVMAPLVEITAGEEGQMVLVVKEVHLKGLPVPVVEALSLLKVALEG